MKNLKRVLSLVLATVMVIGMMVVGASAADYKDADKIDYAEAVEVMSAVGMIEGYDGNFAPEATIDRAGATKLITYLMLGTDVAKKLTVTEAPFEDVPATAWYAPFVAFCAEKGLLEGYNGKFYPNESINAYGFAKLLLGALGYRADIENLTGDTWQVNTATLAIQNGLFNGNDAAFANQAMTRQEACLYAFNALKAVMVTYEGGTNVTLPGGGSVIVNAVRKNVTNTTSTYDGGTENLMQLCEYLYPTLLKAPDGSDVKDAMGRPGYTWTFGEDDEIFVTNAASKTCTGAEYKDFKADLVEKGYVFGANLASTDTVYYYNGWKLTTANGDNDTDTLTKLNNGSLKGATVELYADKKAVKTVVISQAYVAEIDTITKDEDTGVVDVKLENLTYGQANSMTINSKTSPAVYAMVKDYAEGDIIAATYDSDSFWGNPALKLLATDDMDSITGKITSYSTGDRWVKIDGVKYELAQAASNANIPALFNAKEAVTVYLYNGYVMHIAGEEADTEINYAVVLRVGKKDGVFSGDDVFYAELLHTDGTVETVETDKNYATEGGTGHTDLTNCMVTYIVEDDVYELAFADLVYNKATHHSGTAWTVTKGNAMVNGSPANDKTIFVVATDEDQDGEYTYKSYTGIKNVPSLDADKIAGAHPNGAWTVFFALDATVKTTSTTTNDVVYVAGNSKSQLINDADLGEYYTYNAIVNGEITTVNVAKTAPTLDGFYTALTTNDKGLVTGKTEMGNTATVAVISKTGTAKAADGTIKLGNTSSDFFSYDSETVVYVVGATKAITASSISAVKTDANDTVRAYTTNGVLDVVVITKVAD